MSSPETRRTRALRAVALRNLPPALALIIVAACGGAEEPEGNKLTPSFCGDYRVEGDEVCDDGNRADGDYCDSTCKLSHGEWEGCDDGNVIAGDGCGANCEEEIGWGCEGEPSVCGLHSELFAPVLDAKLPVSGAVSVPGTWNALCRWWIALFDPGFDGVAACEGEIFEGVRISGDDCGPMLVPRDASCSHLGDDACVARTSCRPSAICA